MKACLARHLRIEPANDLATGSARVDADRPIGVSYAKSRLYDGAAFARQWMGSVQIIDQRRNGT
jgi:hypothetical protein